MDGLLKVWMTWKAYWQENKSAALNNIKKQSKRAEILILMKPYSFHVEVQMFIPHG